MASTSPGPRRRLGATSDFPGGAMHPAHRPTRPHLRERPAPPATSRSCRSRLGPPPSVHPARHHSAHFPATHHTHHTHPLHIPSICVLPASQCASPSTYPGTGQGDTGRTRGTQDGPEGHRMGQGNTGCARGTQDGPGGHRTGGGSHGVGQGDTGWARGTWDMALVMGRARGTQDGPGGHGMGQGFMVWARGTQDRLGDTGWVSGSWCGPWRHKTCQGDMGWAGGGHRTYQGNTGQARGTLKAATIKDRCHHTPLCPLPPAPCRPISSGWRRHDGQAQLGWLLRSNPPASPDTCFNLLFEEWLLLRPAAQTSVSV